jgi:hypothetical protein
MISGRHVHLACPGHVTAGVFAHDLSSSHVIGRVLIRDVFCTELPFSGSSAGLICNGTGRRVRSGDASERW